MSLSKAWRVMLFHAVASGFHMCYQNIKADIFMVFFSRGQVQVLHEERVSYFTLKSWAMDVYYDACRDHAVSKGWAVEQVLAYVSYMYEDGLERPVENVMWQVILFVLSGGWDKERSEMMRLNINKMLSEYGLENLLAGVSEEEVASFIHDLKVLRIID